MAACAAGPAGAVHVQRQPDDDDVGFLLDHELGDRLVITLDAAAALQDLQRRGDGAACDRRRRRRCASTRDRGRGHGRPSGSRGGCLRSDPQRLVETFRVLAAGGGDVALAATAATDGLCSVLDEVAGNLARLGA